MCPHRRGQLRESSLGCRRYPTENVATDPRDPSPAELALAQSAAKGRTASTPGCPPCWIGWPTAWWRSARPIFRDGRTCPERHPGATCGNSWQAAWTTGNPRRGRSDRTCRLATQTGRLPRQAIPNDRCREAAIGFSGSVWGRQRWIVLLIEECLLFAIVFSEPDHPLPASLHRAFARCLVLLLAQGAILNRNHLGFPFHVN